jgi:hypothetical protein
MAKVLGREPEPEQQKRCIYIRDNAARKSIDDCKHGPVVRLDNIMQNHPISNTVQDLHDILEKFVDIICMQGMHYYLITEPSSPLKLFSPAFVIDMSRKQLEVLPLEDRFHSFGSQYSLQRHFDRHHAFQPGDSCRFLIPNVLQLHSTALCISKIMWPRFTASTCNLSYRGHFTFCSLHCLLKSLLCYVTIWGRRRASE